MSADPTHDAPTLPAPSEASALPPTVRAFVDGRGVEVARGATVLDLVRAHDGAAGDAVADGTRTVTDSRGLPVDPHGATYAGAIYRLHAARRAADAGGDADAGTE